MRTFEHQGADRIPPPLAVAPLLILALIQLAIHTLTNGNYGIFRDEFYYIECARHLDWGYVDQPPLSAAILAVSIKILGTSQQAIRILPALAGAALVFLGGILARRFGGGKFAQVLAACCVLVSPTYLGNTGKIGPTRKCYGHAHLREGLFQIKLRVKTKFRHGKYNAPTYQVADNFLES